MCSICNQQRCGEECPNHTSPSLHSCALCKDGIVIGERYYKIGKSYFHKECLLEGYDKDELLALMGAFPRKARRGVACVFLGVYDAEQNK